MTLNVALLGPASLKGEKLLELLDESELEIDQIQLFEDEDQAGRSLMFRGHASRTRAYADFDPDAQQLVFVADAELAPGVQAKLQGLSKGYLIDLYPERYTDSDVFLCLPAINGATLTSLDPGRVIGVPGSATITAALALYPLHEAYELLKVNLTALVAASESGREGVESLAQETARLMNGREAEASFFGQQLAFNMLPDVGDVQSSRQTSSEQLLREQLQVLLGEDLEVEVSTVRVPAFYGNLVTAQAETRKAVEMDQVQEIMDRADSVRYDHQAQKQPSPVSDAVGQDVAVVHRIRQDAEESGGFVLQAIGDDLGLGGALMALQVAQRLVLR